MSDKINSENPCYERLAGGGQLLKGLKNDVTQRVKPEESITCHSEGNSNLMPEESFTCHSEALAEESKTNSFVGRHYYADKTDSSLSLRMTGNEPLLR